MNTVYKYTVLLPVLFAVGCAAAPQARQVSAVGDPLRVALSCYQANGDLVVTTDKANADNAALKKSSLFFALKDYAPLSLKAGVAPEGEPVTWGFMDELHACVAAAVPGMALGEQREIACKPALVAGREGAERFLSLARVRTRAKEQRVPRAEYVKRVGSEPVVGQPFTLDADFPGTVTEVTETEVLVSFQLPKNGLARTPFGMGAVREAGDRFQIELPLKTGDLVRSGPLAGRVSDMNETMLTIDYGYSFAGEPLRCRIETMPAEVRP
jgi:hypothetical protein